MFQRASSRGAGETTSRNPNYIQIPEAIDRFKKGRDLLDNQGTAEAAVEWTRPSNSILISLWHSLSRAAIPGAERFEGPGAGERQGPAASKPDNC